MTVSRSHTLGSVGIAALLLAGCAGPNSAFGGPPATSSSNLARAQKSSSNEQVVYNFTGGNDGGNAATQLALDKSGNVYGTTVIGGPYTCGTIFEAKPQAKPPW